MVLLRALGVAARMAFASAVLVAAVAASAPGETPGQIVFSSNRSGPWRIWCVGSDGSQLRQLTHDTAEHADVDPAFSPDGRTVLFTSTRGGAAGVWKMSREGTQAERLCDGDQAEWSPEGKRIVLRRNEQVWTRDLAAGGEQCLIRAGGDGRPQWPHCSGPAWSPDGKQIAFACRWDAGNALFLVPATAGTPQTVYDKKGACEPHWSPDGKRLVYETETHVCTIDPDGKKNRPVTYFGGVQRYGRFSPDGASIVYCQGASEQGPWELYIIAAQGGTPRQLTTGGSDMNPDWK